MKDKDFDKEFKSMTLFLSILGLIGVLASIGAVVSVIYFVFWCLKHFGLI